MASAKVHVAPEINDATAPFWEAANDGRLMLKRCLDSGKAFYPPRNFSPFTGSTKTEWIEASGKGTIYSFSVSKRGEEHCIAYVTLEEGPIMLSAMTDCDLNAISIGRSVKVTFVEGPDGQNVPMFTLDE